MNQSERGVFRDYPFLAAETIVFIESLFDANSEILEYGAGGSTIWFGLRARTVLSFERNKAWYDRVKERMSALEIKNVSLRLDQRYWDAPLPDKKFDIIFIDGAKRYFCTKTALPHLAEKGYLILDNAESINPHNKMAVEYLAKQGLSVKSLQGYRPEATTAIYGGP